MDNENFDDYEEMQNMENEMSSFSGNNKIFNKDLSNARNRGFEKFNKKGRATVAITVSNMTDEDKVFELFNTNNSITKRADGSLYANAARKGLHVGNGRGEYLPFDEGYIMNVDADFADGTAGVIDPVAVFDNAGNLIYVDSYSAADAVDYTKVNLRRFINGHVIAGSAFHPSVKISMRSTLNGNSYRRFLEKLQTSVILIDQISIVTNNELQFQTSLAQKDYAMLSTGGDDEIQLSDYIRSTQQNPKAIEIYDKKVLVDGDTRLSGIALAGSVTTYTMSLTVINEITKAVYR